MEAGGSDSEESACNAGQIACNRICIPSLVWRWELEKGRAPHSSILAWRIPWTEKPGGLFESLEVAKSLARLRLTLSLQDNIRVIKLCWGQEKSGRIQPLGGSKGSDMK